MQELCTKPIITRASGVRLKFTTPGDVQAQSALKTLKLWTSAPGEAPKCCSPVRTNSPQCARPPPVLTGDRLRQTTLYACYQGLKRPTEAQTQKRGISPTDSNKSDQDHWQLSGHPTSESNEPPCGRWQPDAQVPTLPLHSSSFEQACRTSATRKSGFLTVRSGHSDSQGQSSGPSGRASACQPVPISNASSSNLMRSLGTLVQSAPASSQGAFLSGPQTPRTASRGSADMWMPRHGHEMDDPHSCAVGFSPCVYCPSAELPHSPLSVSGLTDVHSQVRVLWCSFLCFCDIGAAMLVCSTGGPLCPRREPRDKLDRACRPISPRLHCGGQCPWRCCSATPFLMTHCWQVHPCPMVRSGLPVCGADQAHTTLSSCCARLLQPVECHAAAVCLLVSVPGESHCGCGQSLVIGAGMKAVLLVEVLR